MKRKKTFKLMLTLFVAFLMALPPWVIAQGTQETKEPKPFKQEEIDQLLAPIALYPDDLLSQVLMASTYPIEVVQADRWVKQNKNLKGEALTTELEKQQWDPSVKSLASFPEVLSKMSEKLDWTQKLGDAFLAQQEDIMDTVQNLRAKAQEQGNLKTTNEQKVIVQEKVIIIEPASPQVIYVPTYNPVVVYGSWWWPAFPPPPPFIPIPPRPVLYGAIGFGMGVAVGAAWGYAWGHCNWGRPGHHGVNININQNININKKINRNVYAKQYQGGSGKWQHDASHRKGIAYRDRGTAQKFNRASTREAVRSRESFRGRAEPGKMDLGSSDRNRDLSRDRARDTGSVGDRSRDISRDRTRDTGKGAGSSERGGRESAFGGTQRGSDVRQQSNRGRASRESMSSRGGKGSAGGAGRNSSGRRR